MAGWSIMSVSVPHRYGWGAGEHRWGRNNRRRARPLEFSKFRPLPLGPGLVGSWSRLSSRLYGTGPVSVVGGAVGVEDVAVGYSLLVHDIPLFLSFVGISQLAVVAGTVLVNSLKNGSGLERTDSDEGDPAPAPGRGEGQAATASLSSPSTSLPSDPSMVWGAAWAPLGGENVEEEIFLGRDGRNGREPVAWVGGARREATWVGAMDPWRVEGLFRICLAEIKQAVGAERIGGVDATGDEIDIDGVLTGVARQVAERWLGYVPRVLETETEIGLAREARTYQVVRIDGGSQRGLMYSKVVRLLRGPREGQTRDPISASDSGGGDAAIPVSWSSGMGVLPGGDTTVGNGRPDAHAERLYNVAPSVLHDMVFTVADYVCGAYVQDVVAGGFGRRRRDGKQVAGDFQANEALLWPAFLDARLGSTRDVQRFINRMYLWRLMEEYVLETVAMYEDRLPLTRLVSVSGGADRPGLVIRHGTVRVRRCNELAELKGLKYAVSLLLECHDVMRPMFANCQRWVAGTVSWILREVIGKGIGFVWEGVRNVRIEKKEGNDGNRGQRGRGGQHPGDPRDKPGAGCEPDDGADAWPAAGIFV